MLVYLPSSLEATSLKKENEKRKEASSSPTLLQDRVGSLGKMSNIKHEMFRRPQFVISQNRCIPGRKEELFLLVTVAARGWDGSLASGMACDPSSQLGISCGPGFFYGNFLESFPCRGSFSGGNSWLLPTDTEFWLCDSPPICSISYDRNSLALLIFPKIKLVD